MRQNRRIIKNLLFLLFKGFITIETRQRKLLKHNNAFNSFGVIIINLSLINDSIERIIIKKNNKNRTSINKAL